MLHGSMPTCHAVGALKTPATRSTNPGSPLLPLPPFFRSQEGFGVYPHMRLALELLRAAAAAGDPGAHGHMALRYAVGLDQGDCWTADGVARFAEVGPGGTVAGGRRRGQWG